MSSPSGDGRPGAPRGAATGSSGSAKALVKGIVLVDVVAEANEPVRLAELVERAGLPRATSLRLLDVLLDHGLLRVDRSGRYLLGPRLIGWGQRSLGGLALADQAEDLMTELATTTAETCFLGVRDGHRVLYVAKADGPHAVHPVARVGTRNPLHCTAMGKVLLAAADPADVEDYLAGDLEVRTGNTITDPAELRDELGRTGRCGYATDLIENEDGVRCVAAPVHDHTGAVVASLSVAAPAYRLPEDELPRLAETVMRVALRISHRVGFRVNTGQGAGQ